MVISRPRKAGRQARVFGKASLGEGWSARAIGYDGSGGWRRDFGRKRRRRVYFEWERQQGRGCGGETRQTPDRGADRASAVVMVWLVEWRVVVAMAAMAGEQRQQAPGEIVIRRRVVMLGGSQGVGEIESKMDRHEGVEAQRDHA